MVFDTMIIALCAVLAVLALLSSLSDTLLRKLRIGEGAEVGPSQCGPVSVVIVADNNADELRANLDAFLSQDYAPGYEVIVVVDKDEDGTGDVLKAYGGRPNLYTTFVPASARYMSRRKLAVTLGVKAARNEWVLLTDATCRPCTDRWVGGMSSKCAEGVDMVLGYSNYAGGAGWFKVFYRFHRGYDMFRAALSGAAFGMACNNLMFRKSVFMAGNGFQGNLKYLRGEYEFLVGTYAGHGNVAVEAGAESRMEDSAPSGKAWRERNLFHICTRRQLSGGFGRRLGFAADMLSLHLCLLAALCSGVWAGMAGEWLVLPFSGVALLAPVAVRTMAAKRAMDIFGVGVPLWKVFPFEVYFFWHNLRYALAYRLSDKYEFTSHKS